MGLILVPWSQIEYEFQSEETQSGSDAKNQDPWNSDQPWGQFGGGPDRRQTPPHTYADGGAGNGAPSEAEALGSILDPDHKLETIFRPNRNTITFYCNRKFF